MRRIERFVEKPDETRARAFIADGYLWNSGNFVFRADVMLEELERFEPEIAAATAAAVAERRPTSTSSSSTTRPSPRRRRPRSITR